MAYMEANGLAVVVGTLTIPRLGRAVAELRLSAAADKAPIKAGDKVQLTFEDGTTYQMSAERAGADRGLWRVRLVGGAGGLSKVVKPKYYQGIPAATALKDLLTEAGEEAGAVDLPGSLNYWTRRQGPAGEAIRALFLKFPTRAWRIEKDGKLWAGVEAWPAGPEVSVIAHDAIAGSYMLRSEPTLTPGVECEAIGKVGRVLHRIGEKVRTEAWIEID